MGIERARDIIICIWGSVVTLVILFIGVGAFIIYRKVNAILKSVKTAAAKIEAMTTFAGDNVARPLISIAAFIAGVCQGARSFRKMFGRKGGK